MMNSRLALCNVLFAISLLALPSAKRAQGQISNSIEKRKLDLISDTIAGVMKANDIPSVSAAIVIGEKSYFFNHGTIKRESSTKVTNESIYQIASLSKTFVGIIVNKLIDSGKLDRQSSIVEYLPADLSETTKTKLKLITVEHLLHHRSGLPRISSKRTKDKSRSVQIVYTEADLLRDLDRMKLRFEPGEKFEYSNFAYALLGYLCERASEKSIQQLLTVHVAEPYSLGDTTFSLTKKQDANLVTAYHDEKRSLAVPPWKMGKLSPPSAIFSTTKDLAKLMSLQMAAYKTYDSKQQPGPLVLTHSKHAAWRGTSISYGYGLFDWGNGGLGHGGHMDGYGSEYNFNPKKDRGIVLLTSSCGPWLQRLTVGIERILDNDKTLRTGEIIATEQIIASFESRGKTKGIEVYKRLRERKASPLGIESRVTLINLAYRMKSKDATAMLLSDALEDFPESARIRSIADKLNK